MYIVLCVSSKMEGIHHQDVQITLSKSMFDLPETVINSPVIFGFNT